MSAEVAYTVDFGRQPKTEAAPERPGCVLRVARLLAFARQSDAKVRAGEYADLAGAARKLGVTRARVIQIANLTPLRPAIQEAILNRPPITMGRDPITERALRPIVAEPDWTRQIVLWRQRCPASPRRP